MEIRKKKVLCEKFYENFPPFRKAIITTVNETNLAYLSELKSLLTLKFQAFENVPMYPKISCKVDFAKGAALNSVAIGDLDEEYKPDL